MATKLPPSELADRPLQYVRPLRSHSTVTFAADALNDYFTYLKKRAQLAEASATSEPDPLHAARYAGVASAFHDAAMLFLDICAYRGVPTEDNRTTAPLRPVGLEPEFAEWAEQRMHEVDALLNDTGEGQDRGQ